MKKQLTLLGTLLNTQSQGDFNIDYLVQGVTSNTISYDQTGTQPSIMRINWYPTLNYGYYFQWKFYNSIINVPFELYSFMTQFEYKALEISE